jgi:hypothetical protein
VQGKIEHRKETFHSLERGGERAGQHGAGQGRWWVQGRQGHRLLMAGGRIRKIACFPGMKERLDSEDLNPVTGECCHSAALPPGEPRSDSHMHETLAKAGCNVD